jgi:phage tail-like protein
MRGTVTGLDSPHPLGGLMPAVFQDDNFTMRWTAALDDVLAPVMASLDCIEAYVDPLLAPEDFLIWLAGWSGIVIDENWPLARQRAVVAATAELYRTRGTPAGLRRHIELVTGGQVEIAESGGVTWSTTPMPADTSAPADSANGQGSWVSVRVTVTDPDEINVRALDSLIDAIKPAHVVHRLEVAGS